MSKSVIHIGANKTASTTLQRAVFRNHSGIVYMGEDAVDYAEYGHLVDALAADDDLYFPEEACRAAFQSRLSRVDGKSFVYSNEDLMTSRVPMASARRLKALLPDAHVLLVLRNQYTAMPSFYASHGAFLKPAPPSYFRRHVTFDDWMAFQFMFPKYGALASYDYDRIVAMYAALFGEQRMHFLFFEEFVTDKAAFVEKLSRILEIDAAEAARLLGTRHERPRVTQRMLAYNRLRTRFFWGRALARSMPGKVYAGRHLSRFLSGGAPAKIELSDIWKQRLSEHYAEGNERLATRYVLPLADFGYPMV